MALKDYFKKRDFDVTPEPSGAAKGDARKPGKRLIYVVQKHRANAHAFMLHSLFTGYPSKLSAPADRRISMLLLLSQVKFGQVVARKIVPPRKRSVRCGLFQCIKGI